MEIVSLLLLSRAEIRGKKPGFLKAAFDSKLGKPAELMSGKDLSTSGAHWRLPRNAGVHFSGPGIPNLESNRTKAARAHAKPEQAKHYK
jgi:hypothetical protein